MVKSDSNIHYSHIPLRGHTKEWFQKDIQTIKHSAAITLKRSPYIVLIVLVLASVLGVIYFQESRLYYIVWYTVLFSLISILGYFLLHVLKTKGYDVSSP